MKKLLIVEDDREISKLLQEFLVENEYEAEQAFDGRVASEKLKNQGYDLVLMDMMLRLGADDYIMKPFDLDEVLVNQNNVKLSHRKYIS